MAGPSLTHVVSVRGLGGSVLQARQDLALPDVAVAHQQELEQEVVGPDRTASVAHPRTRRRLPCPIMRGDPAAFSPNPVSVLPTARFRATGRRRDAGSQIRDSIQDGDSVCGHAVQTESNRATSFQREPPTPTSSLRPLCHQRAQDAPRFYARGRKSSADGSVRLSVSGLRSNNCRISSLRLPARAEVVSRMRTEGRCEGRWSQPCMPSSHWSILSVARATLEADAGDVRQHTSVTLSRTGANERTTSCVGLQNKSMMEHRYCCHHIFKIISYLSFFFIFYLNKHLNTFSIIKREMC